MTKNDNFKGALLISLAMAGFTLSDAMIKLVTPHMYTGQIMFVRGAITSVLIFAVAWKLGALRPPRVLADRYLLLRTLGEIVASITYITALGSLPLPNASAILQMLPLAVTMGAAVFFGESVGWRRWGAILVGLIGVLIIIRPGAEGFTVSALLVVVSVLAAATRDLATRRINPNIPSLLISAVTALVVTMVGAVLIVPFGGWKPVAAFDLGALTIGALALFGGYQAVIMAMRTGDMSFVAPFRYTSLIWSIALGAFMLGEFPDTWMLVGSAIVIAAGLYAFNRERQRHRAPAMASDNQLAP
ncbi:DMT family transporter [Rhizobium sp. KVB221]|uniref:DMT family transporter n=1 Tax=Rhizobium setariae TaxID=2801340 RepID=A0A936YP65_9HYPH|nr:DMT family transporter [Rhizobium setariae]MBL0373098.1 DMT family transporter [Rhizobium setariae]